MTINEFIRQVYDIVGKTHPTVLFGSGPDPVILVRLERFQFCEVGGRYTITGFDVPLEVAPTEAPVVAERILAEMTARSERILREEQEHQVAREQRRVEAISALRQHLKAKNPSFLLVVRDADEAFMLPYSKDEVKAWKTGFGRPSKQRKQEVIQHVKQLLEGA